MKPETWQKTWNRLAAEGWRLEQNRVFKPLLGRHWCVEAVQRPSGRRYAAEAPTLKIAIKKLDRMIQGDIKRDGNPEEA